MRISRFFELYGEADDVEIFRFEDLSSVPNRIGLYAWYARPRVSVPDEAADAAAWRRIVHEQVFERFQRAPYRVQLSASLEPQFNGRVEQVAPLPSPPASNADCRDALSQLSQFLSGAFSPLFSSPLYIGKAERQTLRERVTQHVAKLSQFTGKPAAFLEQQRLALTAADSSLQESDAHSFALEVAARRFRLEQLILVTWAPSKIGAQELSTLEVIANRVVFPLCGRR